MRVLSLILLAGLAVAGPAGRDETLRVHEKRDSLYSPQVVFDEARTVVAFPKSTDWWTIGSVNVVEWWWAQTYAPNLQVVLGNPDANLMPWGAVLGDNIEARLLSIRVSSLTAIPGPGYFISLLDRANTSNIYATSEAFEIRPNGSTPVVNPLPYGPLNVPRSSTSGAQPVAAAPLVIAGSVFLALLVQFWAMPVGGLSL